MKIILLSIINLYWNIIPKEKRRRCIFRVSCSQYVYQITQKEGLYKGLLAFGYRFKNCRGGYQILDNPIDGRKMMVLPNSQIITENEIAERFIEQEILFKLTSRCGHTHQ